MIERNLDNKQYSPIQLYRYITKETEEVVAHFTEKTQLTIPEKDSIVNLRTGKVKFDDEGVDIEETSRYRVIDIEYEYTLVRFDETDEVEAGDQIVTAVDIFVEPLSAE